ncbi:hypothetical protein ACFQPF_03620 [Fictibacillus iocasae]|uniref:Uncharacterized protein n=1 Tax=Fictibacillus iocasae TaxID=2715437 RepID=A0ABW2NNQ0_9BACL
MSVTTKRKETVCKQYSLYLKIIYHYGNKVMLFKQLHQYSEALGLSKSYSHFHNEIKDLIEANILRKEPFIAFGKTTQLHFLTMRKYGIRFIEGKNNSAAVGAVPKANTNERILISLFKNSYILDKIIPRLNKHHIDVCYESINKMLRDDKSTILFNKNKGLEYLNTWNDVFVQKYFDVDAVKYDIKSLQDVNEKKMQGLKKGSKASVGKGNGKLLSGTENSLETIQERYYELPITERGVNDKYNKLNKYNIDSMLNGYSYISQIKLVKDVFTITVLIFDINNHQNIYKIGTQIASIFHMFARYINNDLFIGSSNFKLKIGVISLDEQADSNLKNKAYKKVRDYISKEMKGQQLQVILKNWNVSEDICEKYIEVHFANYNLTNRYLEGIKYCNLIRK